MGTLRTKEGEEHYRSAIEGGALKTGCVLCAKPALKMFTRWKIIRNDFPYDKIATLHDMIVPIRHVSGIEISEDERVELDSIKHSYIDENYEWTLEATARKKSIPDHFHLHLIVARD